MRILKKLVQILKYIKREISDLNWIMLLYQEKGENAMVSGSLHMIKSWLKLEHSI